MKKIIACLLAICMGVSFTVSAQSVYTKQKEKKQKKEYKQKIKTYNKDGWQIFGSSHTLDVALLYHYEKLEKDDVFEIAGQANKNIGKDKLMLSAASTYASMIGSNIKGRIVEDMGSILSTEELSEFDHFYAAYENEVKAEIRGELRPSYTVYRETTVNGKPAYEFEALYIVDEVAASRARLRAFQNAAKESAVAQKYAEQVSNFIKEASVE